MRKGVFLLALACSQTQAPWRGALGVLDAVKYGEEALAGAASWARGDTLGLTEGERREYLEALGKLPSEEALRALIRLAYRHGFGPEAQRALGVSLPEDELRKLLSGEEVRLFPEPEPAPEGPVAEAWPDGYLEAFLELSRWGFMLPVTVPRGKFYALLEEGYVEVQVEDSLFSPPEALPPERTYLLVPAKLPFFKFEEVKPRLDGVAWCFGFDSVRAFQAQPPLLYARAWKGSEDYTLVLVADSSVPGWARVYPPGSAVLSVELLGAVDLDSDGEAELVIVEEGEVTRRWDVLKKKGASWVSVYTYALEEEVD